MTTVSVRVVVQVNAPVERVFDAVSDHETFLRTDDGTITKIVRPGDSERNGLGCLREVRAGVRGRYLEEITAWERPTSFEYQIRETSLPLRHFGSRIVFTAKGSATEVEWTSRFEIRIPILGRFLVRKAERGFTKVFTNLLLAAKSRLEKDPGAPHANGITANGI